DAFLHRGELVERVDVERDVIDPHRKAQTGGDLRLPSRLLAHVLERKEAERLAAAHVEEEMAEPPLVGEMVLRMDETHSQTVGIEVVRGLDVARGEGDVVQAGGSFHE